MQNLWHSLTGEELTLKDATKTTHSEHTRCKHFDGSYSVVDTDKFGNKTHYVRDSFAKANAKYNKVLSTKHK